MATVRTFEELAAWKQARELANAVYALSNTTPLAKDFGLRDQLRRAAVSVLSNIAEGFERDTTPDFIHFLFMAKGSAGEIRAQLYIALDQGLITREQFEAVSTTARYVSGIIARLIAYLKGHKAKAPKAK